jgi:hypothetical protein
MELVLNETWLGSRPVRRALLADFGDVPPTHGSHDCIANVALDAVASGCGGGNDCPELATTREQMAVFLSDQPVRRLGPGQDLPAAVPASQIGR